MPKPFVGMSGSVCCITIYAIAMLFLLGLGLLIQAKATTLVYGKHPIHDISAAVKLCLGTAGIHAVFLVFFGYQFYLNKKQSAAPRVF